MIKRAEKFIPGLASSIAYQELWTPETLDTYAMSGTDASIGWALSPEQVGPKTIGSTDTDKKSFFKRSLDPAGNRCNVDGYLRSKSCENNNEL